MSELRKKQEEFTVAIAKLILAADEQGITLSFGDAYRDPRVFGPVGTYKGYGHPRSCHKLKLADDFNFEFESDHVKAHNKWDEMGGARRLLHDMNHYSSGWEDMI
jgi:hypothetical protein